MAQDHWDKMRKRCRSYGGDEFSNLIRCQRLEGHKQLCSHIKDRREFTWKDPRLDEGNSEIVHFGEKLKGLK